MKSLKNRGATSYFSSLLGSLSSELVVFILSHLKFYLSNKNTTRKINNDDDEGEELYLTGEIVLSDGQYQMNQILNGRAKITACASDQFEREAVVLANWLRDQEVLALSQDFGQDLRHAVNY
ncbi:hypothetical protein BpHYR1_015740 [Brachionus plicatilis]|uniref:Uncharacterized protein n=1 Tax=Brachionus plicatilis TaxID=10195 RepID=A0A3M7RE37_BRAPC|nr:hypothetical protein BpHYR1_015740 [Brachionus plicatilis]